MVWLITAMDQWIHFSASVSIVVTFSNTVIKKKDKKTEKWEDLFCLSFEGTVQHGSRNHGDSVKQLAAMYPQSRADRNECWCLLPSV